MEIKNMRRIWLPNCEGWFDMDGVKESHAGVPRSPAVTNPGKLHLTKKGNWIKEVETGKGENFYVEVNLQEAILWLKNNDIDLETLGDGLLSPLER